MKKPKISVVIPAYNEENYIGKCLESLRNQDYKSDFEIIVNNNGSTDKTGEIAKSHGAKVIFTPKSNQAAARQDGLRLASGNILAALDADNTAVPFWLSTIDQEFAKDPKLVSIFGFIKPLEGKILDKILLFLGNYVNLGAFYVTGRPILIGTNQAVKREVFEEIGGFEPLKLPLIHCDIFDQEHLMRNLRNAGKIKFTPKMQISYSMRKFHELGYFAMFWKGFLAWLDLVFLKKFQYKIPQVRKVRIRKNFILDQAGFLLFVLTGATLSLVISPLLFPVFILIHHLTFGTSKILLKRVAIVSFVFLVVFVPAMLYFLTQSSVAEENITINKLRERLDDFKFYQKLENLTDSELLQLFNQEKLQEILKN